MVTAAKTVRRIGAPRSQAWTPFIATAAFASLVVATVAMCLAAVGSMTFPGDTTLMRAFQSHDAPVWRAFMSGITDVGGGWVALTVAGLLAMFLFLRGRVIDALATAAIFSVTVVIPVLKQFVERPRPSGTSVMLIGHFSGSSFPSGHSALAMVFCGVLFYLAPRLVRAGQRMWTLRMGLVALLIFTGLSRVYLGVHWPSDVIGGFLVGAVLVSVLAAGHMLVMRHLGPDFGKDSMQALRLSLTSFVKGGIVSVNRRESPSHYPGAPLGVDALDASNLAASQVVL